MSDERQLEFCLVLTGGERRLELERFFLSIAAQTYRGNVRVVFVDQAGLGVPQGLRFPGNVTVRTIPAGGRLPLSVARNLALPAIEGDVVAFPDDDCWYPPDLLDQLARRLRQIPAVACICTSVFDPDKHQAFGKRNTPTERRVSFWNLFKYPISVGIFIRRGALESAGPRFDERLGVGTAIGSGEETELLARVLGRGFPILYVGGLRVFHPVATLSSADVAKYERYGFGYGYLHGRIATGGELRVLAHLAEVIGRSAGGALYHARRPLLRRVYLARLEGIVRGLAAAFRGEGLGSPPREVAGSGRPPGEDQR